MNIVDRVTKLVALTASPNENEAAAAAVQACRLIRAHGLTVSGGRAAAGGSWLDDIKRECAERDAREAALAPFERARVRCARLNVSRRDELATAVRLAIECGLSDQDVVALVRELQANTFQAWSGQEIDWVIRSERRAVVHGGAVG